MKDNNKLSKHLWNIYIFSYILKFTKKKILCKYVDKISIFMKEMRLNDNELC